MDRSDSGKPGKESSSAHFTNLINEMVLVYSQKAVRQLVAEHKSKEATT